MRKNLLLILVAIICSTAIYAQIPANIPNNGLLAWYPFNGNPNDESGNNKHLTNYNSTLVPDRFGKANSAYLINGGNYSYLYRSSSFPFGNDSSFTISVWINRNSNTSGRVAVQDQFYSGTNNRFFYGFCVDSLFTFYAREQLGISLGNSQVCQTSYSTGIWISFVGVYDNKVMKLYKNGILVDADTLNTTLSIGSTHTPFYIGDIYLGMIDDVAVWDRVLTPAEILSLYGTCSSLVINSPEDTTLSIMEDAAFVATGYGYCTYKWQMKQGNNFVDISNGGQYSGATSDTLIISNLEYQDDGMRVRCIIKNGLCRDT
ncbi:MAG: hypothetical protein DRI84_08905, partial [Bacteroidetes bacterium]